MKIIKYGFLFILIVVSVLPVSAKSPFKSVGLAGGVNLSQGGWNVGPVINIRTDLGEAVKYVHVTPYISYSHATRSYIEDDASEQLTVGYVSLGTKFYGYLNSRPRGPYVGGGISYNMISYKRAIANDDPTIETRVVNTSKIGFSALAGFQLPVNKFTFFAETEYIFTHGGFNQFIGLLGAVYVF